MNNIIDIYEKRKNDLAFEIWFIEGVQYNFKLEDFEELLDINKANLYLFKKYLYYLNLYRMTYHMISSDEEFVNNFYDIVLDDPDKEKLLNIFLKHDHLFCDENNVRRLKLVPIKYKNRIFRGI